jgi:hypothetical protein
MAREIAYQMPENEWSIDDDHMGLQIEVEEE